MYALCHATGAGGQSPGVSLVAFKHQGLVLNSRSQSMVH